MATKYIVDNLSGQTITGDITINGNLTVTGVTSSSLATYKALFTQTQVITANNLFGFNNAFIVGETYTITSYNSGDDFSNIANVQIGTINQTGCVFIATGQIPFNWTNNSVLESSGNLVVDVLENNLGYDILWAMNPFGGSGIYLGINNTTGPIYNNFNRLNVSVMTQLTSVDPPPPVQIITGSANYTTKDDVLYVVVWDFDIGNTVNDTFYYTPVEVQIKQDLDTTPITLNGTISPSFPFNYVSVNLYCDGSFVESFIGDNTTVINITEMVNQLNTDPTTSYLGTYSEGGPGGVILTMPTNLVNQFCSNGTLTFEVFAD